ncbi:DnaJ-domain-containing protein [Delitschia confertaspora ATCC 74209]|uniref:DnaJ-domain-containing protein n=1 Tax=Delitschia confertaspora ATCC 74209 TaxID=1513339 RepID=A0A9P4MX17_9PLEO|nr:DnaJ-domain-containing protein [Delitschia confertaspora ATCC 74209]
MAEEDDILKALETDSKEFDKDAEIDRILAAFRLNAYEVLDLLPGVPESDIKKCYRTKSLLIHPDKTSNPKAPDAFDRLKKAQTVLLDEKERSKLDEAIADARTLTIRELKITKDDEMVKSEEFRKKWSEKTKWVMMDNEVQKKKRMMAQMREEGREQRKEEEEIAARKRKREHEEAWEKTRDTRIDSWRSFQKGNEKKGGKKKKVKALG